MRRLIWGSMCLASAAAGALSGAPARSAADGAVVRELVPPAGAAVPADLPESSLSVEVEPRAVRAAGGGELLELELDLRTAFRGKASVRHAYTLVTDDGRVVSTAPPSPIARLAAGARTRAPIVTPAGLADGYYRLHVTAAGSDGGEHVVASTDGFFQVAAGTVTPLSARDYYARSNANRALPRSKP